MSNWRKRATKLAMILGLLSMGVPSASQADPCAAFAIDEEIEVTDNASIVIHDLTVTPSEGGGSSLTVRYAVTTSGSESFPDMKARIQLDVLGLVVDDGPAINQQECFESGTFQVDGTTQEFQETFTLTAPADADSEVESDGGEGGFQASYQVAVEVAYVSEGVFMFDADPGDNQAQMSFGNASVVVASDVAAEGQVGSNVQLRATLTNNGTRPTGPLRLVWRSGDEEETVEGESLLAQGQEGATRSVEKAFASAGRTTLLQVFATENNLLLSSVAFAVEDPSPPSGGGSGSGGSSTGGGGSTGGGSTSGGGGSSTPPPMPTGTGDPDYEIVGVTVISQDPAQGVFVLRATVRNRGGTATVEAPISWHGDQFVARNEETGQRQENAVIASLANALPPLAAGATGPAPASVVLAAEQDPDARANFAVGQVSVNLPGDTNTENNTKAFAVPLGAAPGDGVQPPRFAFEAGQEFWMQPGYAFEDAILSLDGGVRNVGGPAKRVVWDWGLEDLTPDPEDTAEQQDLPSIGVNRLLEISRGYLVPRRMHPAAGQTPTALTGSARVTAYYDDAEGTEKTVTQNIPIAFPFTYEYPRIDLGIHIAFMQDGTGAGIMDRAVVQEGVELDIGLVVVNNGELPIKGDLDLTAGLTLNDEEVEFTDGEFGEDIEVNGRLHLSGKITFTCAQVGEIEAASSLFWPQEMIDALPEPEEADPATGTPAPGSEDARGPDSDPNNDLAFATLIVRDDDGSCTPPEEDAVPEFTIEIGDAVIIPNPSEDDE